MQHTQTGSAPNQCCHKPGTNLNKCCVFGPAGIHNKQEWFGLVSRTVHDAKVFPANGAFLNLSNGILENFGKHSK